MGLPNLFKSFLITISAVTVFAYISTANDSHIIKDTAHTEKPIALAPLVAPVYAEKQELTQVAVPPPKPAVAPASGSCGEWMAQAGISDPDAVWLIGKESGCRPTAQNPTSTAYGIFQFLDGTWKGVGCVKTSDPVQQMICGQRYVMARYNSWAGARAFHQNNNWY